jgi:hypothetical protein
MMGRTICSEGKQTMGRKDTDEGRGQGADELVALAEH